MNNWEEKKIRTFYSICILWCISNDLYHDISSGMGDEEGDEPITNKEYPGGRVGLGARVIKVRLLFRPWFWWRGGGSDQENFWLICPVLPDSDQLYFNFHLPPKNHQNMFPCCILYLQIHKYNKKFKSDMFNNGGVGWFCPNAKFLAAPSVNSRPDLTLINPDQRGVIVTMLSLILMISSSCRCRKKMQWL